MQGQMERKVALCGAFAISNLLELEGGKVMAGTDENGVPNERSASILGQYLGSLAESQTFAPLHIARWDHKLFDSYKKQIIKDVEEKIVFPLQTIQLTRVWILRTINNRWRAYKSKLKKQYFNREERTLDQIIPGRPRTVNEHQWRALVGIWCQETHKDQSFEKLKRRRESIRMVIYHLKILMRRSMM
ncbi:hypothetical protein U9M48_008862 [Paspalum notatum var. saurae]|uniref:Uncharacterized protein n=1 Tax=Paspalum notatum var. saurae TaxID=547442 RepID=A0AAQ3SPV4_PASNO